MALLCAALSGCGDRIRGKVIRQLPQPGGGLTAILTEDYGWNVYYDVYLKRDQDGFVERVFSTFDNDAAPQIRWQNPKALVVSMACGDIVHYENEFPYKWKGEYQDAFIGLEGNLLCKHQGEAAPGL
jgi:hypothetical protein